MLQCFSLFPTERAIILKLSFTSYILSLAVKTNLANKGGNDVKYFDCKYFSKQKFLVFLLSRQTESVRDHKFHPGYAHSSMDRGHFISHLHHTQE